MKDFADTTPDFVRHLPPPRYKACGRVVELRTRRPLVLDAPPETAVAAAAALQRSYSARQPYIPAGLDQQGRLARSDRRYALAAADRLDDHEPEPARELGPWPHERIASVLVGAVVVLIGFFAAAWAVSRLLTWMAGL